MKDHKDEGCESHLVSSRSWDGATGWFGTTLGERRAIAAIGISWAVAMCVGAFVLIRG